MVAAARRDRASSVNSRSPGDYAVLLPQPVYGQTAIDGFSHCRGCIAGERDRPRAIDLQTQIVKMGLNCHIISSGANHSLLASHAAAWGYGVSGTATSYSGRNLLGVEWVLPTGEVVPLGSAGAGCGWFSPDGPGPSMRGIVRGFQGSFGGLGVFTKCAIKLYKWDGPREWEFEGQSPKYVLKEIPLRSAMNAIAFPSRKAEKDAGYKMGEAELNHGEFRTPMFFAALGLTETNEELKIALESGIFQKIGKNIISTAVFAASDAEFAWKMKALKQILKETGGVIIPMTFRCTRHCCASPAS